MTGFVYFVQGIDGGPIKIGFTKNPVTRLSILQIGSPVRLKALRFIEGSQGTERVIQNRFAEYRLHGEWFEPALALLSYISTLDDAFDRMIREAVERQGENVRRNICDRLTA